MNNKRKTLKKVASIGGVVATFPSIWVKPIINSVILPAHALTSPPPYIYITTVTVSDDIGGNPALRRVSFLGQAGSDNPEYFYDAVVNVVISTNTDTVAFDVTVGGYLGGTPGQFETQDQIIDNSTFGNISIKVESLGIVCDLIVVANDVGISTSDDLQHLNCMA